MKIAIILNSFPKISEKFLLNHLIGLVNAGCDIHIFAARKFPQEPYHGIYYDNHMDRYTTWLGIPYKPLPRFLKAPVLFLRLFARNPRAAFEALKFGKYRTVAKNCKLLYFGNAFHGKHFDISTAISDRTVLSAPISRNAGMLTGLLLLSTDRILTVTRSDTDRMFTGFSMKSATCSPPTRHIPGEKWLKTDAMNN